MKKGLKAIIDTNIIISAILGKSATLNKIYEAFVNASFTPVLSPALKEELFNVIKKPRIRKLFRAREIKRFQELIKTDTESVIPVRKVTACRDPKDDILLETAIACTGVDCIVTGDEDLLVLKSFSGIPIITAREFLNLLKE